jgi:hypothetical protein
MKIPTNFRRLKPSEQLRVGDRYVERKTGNVNKLDTNTTCTAGYYERFTFWRQRVKANTVKKSKPVVADKLPVVGFTYSNPNTTWRIVKVTKATTDYIEGFEQISGEPFKRFLRTKAEGVHLLNFNS